jgi:hypothetical protein
MGVEAACFDHVQADCLLRVRDACSSAPSWSDDDGSSDITTVGMCALHSPAAHRSALGWATTSAMSDGCSFVWQAAVTVADILEREVATLCSNSSLLQSRVVCKTLEDAAELYCILVVDACQPFESARCALLHINSLKHLSDSVTLLPLTLASHTAAQLPVLSAAASAAAALARVADAQQEQFTSQLASRITKSLQALPNLRKLAAKSGLDARRTVQRACKALRSVSEALARSCCPAMHVCIYIDMLGRVCHSAADKILELPDLSPQDCDDVHGVLESLWVDTVAAVVQDLVDGVDTDENGRGKLPGWTVQEVGEMIEGACKPLRKLKALGRMLQVRMVEIVEEWELGHLQESGLTREEVLGVLKAVFEDNPHRRKCVDRILGVGANP